MPEKINLWLCDNCQRKHHTEDAAKYCESTHFTRPVKLKDFKIMGLTNPKHKGNYPQNLYIWVDGTLPEQYVLKED